MSTIELVLTKYNTESMYIVTFEEMINDFNTFEPTKIPIIDISILSTIGKYMYEYTNYHKWNISSNLEDEIINMINNLTNKIININDLKLIFQKHKNNKNSPECYALENELLKFVEEIIKKKFPMFQLKELLDFRMLYNKEYTSIMNNYKIDFNEIEIKINNISDIISKKFVELENLPAFEDTIKMLDNVHNKVDIKMKKLIQMTNEQIKIAKEQTKNLNGYNGLVLFEQLKKDIMIIFDNEMDLYFENEIKALKFDDTVNNVLLQLYDVEKAMYRFSVTLSEVEFLIN
jgi:hypothetical protein